MEQARRIARRGIQAPADEFAKNVRAGRPTLWPPAGAVGVVGTDVLDRGEPTSAVAAKAESADELFRAASYSEFGRAALRARAADSDLAILFDSTTSEPVEELTAVVRDAFAGQVSSRYVSVFADGNPQPVVVSFRFTPASGRAAASTRIRLAKTQNVIALAETSDGSLYRTSREVQVTIGGCTG